MATDSMMTDLTLFSHLIPEMRIEIWKSLLERNRVITIDDETRPRERNVALKSLNAHLDVIQPTGATFRILFNSNDTIFINTFRRAAAPLFTSGSVTQERSCFSNLRHLAIHENNLYRFSLGRDGDEAFISAIAKIPSLETLSIVKAKNNDLLHIPTNSELLKYLNEDLQNPNSLPITSARDEKFKSEKYLITGSTKRVCLEDITIHFMRHKENNPSWNLPAIKVKTVFKIAEFSPMIDEVINKYRDTLGRQECWSIRRPPNEEWIFEAEDSVREQKTRILKELYKIAALGFSPMFQLAAEVYLIQIEIFREREAQIEAAKPRRRPRRNPTRISTALKSQNPK